MTTTTTIFLGCDSIEINLVFKLNRDNLGHISLSLPNLSQLASYQNMKISKIGTKSGHVGTELGKKKTKLVQICM